MIYFNPRSHEGSDLGIPNMTINKKISIHAPTRGATKSCDNIVFLNSISIHAPTRGATVHDFWQFSEFYNFNPRSHEGSDFSFSRAVSSLDISIHAPTRGATKIFDFSFPIFDISIHAPTRGATLFSDVSRMIFDISIHAPTRGATRTKDFMLWLDRFQSTLPRGERLLLVYSFRTKI